MPSASGPYGRLAGWQAGRLEIECSLADVILLLELVREVQTIL